MGDAGLMATGWAHGGAVQGSGRNLPLNGQLGGGRCFICGEYGHFAAGCRFITARPRNPPEPGTGTAVVPATPRRP